MAIVFTDLARQRFAARDAGGADVMVDNVRIGNTVSYDATPNRVALMDPSPVRYNIGQVSLTANEAKVAINTSLDYAPAQRGREVGYFDGGDLLALWSTAGQNVFSKAANTRALLTLIYRYVGQGTPTELTADVNVSTLVKADDTVIDAATDDERYMTIRGVVRAIGNWWRTATVPVSKLVGTIAVSSLPKGTTTGTGVVQLATAAEIRAALAGMNPAATIENKVVSLERLYEARDAYIRDNNSTISQTDFDARTVRVPGRIFYIPE